MSEEILTATFSRVFSSGLIKHPFTIAWHAGEPLVVGVEYYRQAFALAEKMKSREQEFKHSIQTNATLITPEWISLFKEFDVQVGVSLDGPDFIHDLHRKKRNGTGTHASVMKGVRLLQDAKVSFHTISVVTRDSLAHAAAIYEFLKETGAKTICLNVEETEAAHGSSSLGGEGSVAEEEKLAKAFRAFMMEMFLRVTEDGHKVRIREIDGALSAIQNWKEHRLLAPRIEAQQTFPYKIISVDHLGNFSTYSPELLGENVNGIEKFAFGNVLTTSFEEASKANAFSKVYREIQDGISKCRAECSYFDLCGGGSPANKFFERGSFVATETVYCNLHRMSTIDAVLDGLEIISDSN